jgi:Ca-activated chloride channel family protein
VINTIGIGTVNGAPIPDAATGQMKTDAEGNTVVSKLNEEELINIAENGNGIYQLYSSTEEVVARLSAQLASMDQRTVTEDSLINYNNFFQVFLGLAFIFLLIELFMSEIKRKAAELKAAAMVVIFILAGNITHAQGGEKTIIKEGNDAYKKADYTSASQSYGKVILKNPENATAQYNLGNALYKLEKKEEAVAAYDKAATQLSKPVEKSNALYNKGVVFQNDKKLPECIEAYKTALKLDPNNEDARQNLQKALQQQKKQEQEQKENEKKNKNKQPQQDKNKDQQQPKPKPSKLTKKEAEEKLKALMEKEKNLQDKLRRVGAPAPDKPEKDW